MRGNWMCGILLSLMAAASLGACASNGVPQGIVRTSGPTQPQTYTSSNAPGGYAPASAYGSATATPATTAAAVPGTMGRVVAINEVALAGSGGGGYGNGPLIGGILGGLGGAAIGIGTSRGAYRVGGGIIGGVLGAVGGAIMGAIVEQHGTGPLGGGRGIEVTVEKDDGSKVTIAQKDDGDVQLGDRVQIVQGRNGAAMVVRDNSHTPDQSQGSYAGNAPPPNYSQPRSNVAPQDDPRYGNLN
jgi:outer membrane lipoprotein SlyB